MDRLERDLSGRLRVVRVDANSGAGRELGPRYRFLVTPTFILFDGEGNEVWRSVGRLDRAAVQAKVP